MEVKINKRGCPEGYLTTTEYAHKNFVSASAVAQQIRRGRIDVLRIGKLVFIKEETPYPDRLQNGRKKEER